MAGLAGAGLLLAAPHLAGLARSRRSRLALAVAPLGLALVAGLAGPAAYALDTVSTTYTGSIPSAGPQSDGFGGGPGGGRAARSGAARAPAGWLAAARERFDRDRRRPGAAAGREQPDRDAGRAGPRRGRAVSRDREPPGGAGTASRAGGSGGTGGPGGSGEGLLGPAA